MNLSKHTKTYSMEDFYWEIKESDYYNYFTEKEISLFGNKKKRGSLAVRYILKQLLIEHFNNEIRYTDIEVLNDKMGKPTLNILNQNIETNNIYFSLSHSKDMVAILLIFENHEV